ncbi:UNVERIFIED_CONTAM: hypothetical protein GTU68_036990 [Idotea baltica]|nr:hypothetical protein [Idotea baltica]
MAINNNLETIQQRISAAAIKAGRPIESVKLIAVSKTKPMSLINEAWEAGQVDFGENRVQELREKSTELPQAHWHMIGGLQRNKVKYIAPFIHLIHSVDSPRLLKEINKQAKANERIINCLIQVNISNEDVKSGVEDENELMQLLNDIDSYPHVHIQGLMGMASFTSNQEVIRSQFRRLRVASEAAKSIVHPRITLNELSMGMSGDFELAIEEGATMVRIGSSVFGHR